MFKGHRIKAHEKDGHITEAGRQALPKSDFAVPAGETEKDRHIKGRYPIDTIARARNALARVSQFGSPEEKSEVEKHVHEKYPDMLIGRRRH